MDPILLAGILIGIGIIAFAAIRNIVMTPDGPDNPPEPNWRPNWIGWWEKPMNEWPRYFEVAPGVILPIGYVLVSAEKAPLYHLVRKNEPVIYENPNLKQGTDRIIAKYGKWLPVVADGDVYKGGFREVRPFGEQIDGTDIFWKVAHEVIVDGLPLWELGLPEMFIRVGHTEPTTAFRN